MTDAEIRDLILRLICELVPEADPALARDRDDIREVFDLDSMDFTNLVVAVHDRTKVSIPGTDYHKLFTLESGVAYLRNALARLQS
jgi:acyl carrier protein